MRAAVLVEPGAFELRDVEGPDRPGAQQVVVRVRRVGICGTDLHAYRGRQPFLSYPRILGHELAVEVLDVGAGVADVQAGDLAAVRPALSCGACDACGRGYENACSTLAVLGAHVDGGLRERLLLPSSALHASATLTLDELALVEPLSIGGHAVVRGAPVAEDRVLVIGAGPVGLAVTAHLLARGLRPLVADVSASRRDFAATWAGVECVDLAPDAVGLLRRAMQGELATLVFDATGNPVSMHAAFDLLAPGGRLVLVGLFQGDLTFHDPEFHRRELSVVASRNATAADFRRSMGLIEAGHADVAAWITQRATLDDVSTLFPVLEAPASGALKAIVDV